MLLRDGGFGCRACASAAFPANPRGRPEPTSIGARLLPLAEHFIATYGLLVVFLGTLLEGETIAIMAGFLAHQGAVDGRLALLVAFLGALTSDQVLFLVGRRFADHPMVMRQRKRPLFAKALKRVEASATLYILIFRFLYGLRTVSPLAIGVSNVSLRKFAILNAIAAFIWASAMIGIGFAFGRTIEVTLGRFHHVEHILIAMVAVGIVSFVGLTFLHRRFIRRQDAQG
jgi:membrane protein DedA with SNARE-associated domain